MSHKASGKANKIMAAVSPDSDMKWRAEEAIRTLTRAEEILS